jgi:hypothetical protein
VPTNKNSRRPFGLEDPILDRVKQIKFPLKKGKNLFTSSSVLVVVIFFGPHHNYWPCALAKKNEAIKTCIFTSFHCFFVVLLNSRRNKMRLNRKFELELFSKSECDECRHREDHRKECLEKEVLYFTRRPSKNGPWCVRDFGHLPHSK